MDFALFSLNLNKFGRGKALERALNGVPTIVKSESGKPLTGFVVEPLTTRTLRIRISAEQGKEPVIENGFDNFISGLKSLNQSEVDVYGIESGLEEKRNPANMIEFIVQNVGKKAPKFKLQCADFVSNLKVKDLKSALALENNLKIGNLIRIYKAVQNPINIQPLSKKSAQTKQLLKSVIERLETLNFNLKEPPQPMVAKFFGAN